MQRTAISMLGSMFTRSVEVLDRVGFLSGAFAGEAGTGARLADYLAQERNHRKVKRSMPRQRRTEHGASVPFVATALRHVGVLVPRDGVLDGHVISRISRALSRYLQRFLDWQRIGEAVALQPGDVIFTADAHCCPGIPAQVLIFLGWDDQARLIARVADDRGTGHAYPLCSPAPDAAPFAYALRAPA